MSEKIRPSHLERGAHIYVRQSTMHQVRHNLESQRRQYDLRGRAEKLGFRSVVVIDEDLGRSGSGSQDRPGFDRLVKAVCCQQVGAVFAIEASRLARNNRDWHVLVDVCGLTDTLVIDHDGIYDPKSLNDRLLLGLKGTLSELELGLIRQRAQEALRQMIARGEVLTEVPAGFIRTRDNRCEMDPDRRVQSAIRGVFEKFREYGSGRQVLLWYRQERVLLPRGRPATRGQEVYWRLPVYNQILTILKNPTYAGAFAYGRYQTRTRVIEGRARKTVGHAVPRGEWKVLIQDHHPGYISWDEYLRNQEILEGNAGMRGRMKRGAVKRGPALLAGLLRCGRCGRKLHVSYSGKGGQVGRYHCRGAHLNHGEAWCISFGGLRVDRAVATIVLDALQPIGVEAAIKASARASQQEDAKREALQLALEQARYEAQRARRQYDVVDPENRLVAAELEARWNDTLRRVAEAEQHLSETPEGCSELDETTRERLMTMGQDLYAMWDHPKASICLKKRILRTVIEEIVADVTTDPPEVCLWIHWAGGVHTEHHVPKNKIGHHRRVTDCQVVDVVRELAKVCPDHAIANILNRLGYKTGAGNTWTKSSVCNLRSYRRIPKCKDSADRSWLTLEQAARALGISASSARRLVTKEIMPARQAVRYAPWVIESDSLDLAGVQRAAKAIKEGRRVPPPGSSEQSLPLFAIT